MKAKMLGSVVSVNWAWKGVMGIGGAEDGHDHIEQGFQNSKS